jgi:hypothetical protein
MEELQVSQEVEKYVREVAAKCPYCKLTAMAVYTNRTPLELVQDVIEAGLPPSEFVAELEKFWSTTVN